MDDMDKKDDVQPDAGMPGGTGDQPMTPGSSSDMPQGGSDQPSSDQPMGGQPDPSAAPSQPIEGEEGSSESGSSDQPHDPMDKLDPPASAGAAS